MPVYQCDNFYDRSLRKMKTVMNNKRQKRFLKAISLLCAFSVQFNAFAGWSEVWSYVRDKTKSAAQDTKEWISCHKEEITTTIAVATAVIIACNSGCGSVYSSPSHHSGGYAYKSSRSHEGAYKPFTQAQKADILRQNRERNGGVLRSDYSGKILEEPRRYTKGCTPSPNEAQIDHITPRSRGGWNSADNAQVLARDENLRKSDNSDWRK